MKENNGRKNKISGSMAFPFSWNAFLFFSNVESPNCDGFASDNRQINFVFFKPLFLNLKIQ